MTTTIDFYWNDLSEEKQKELLALLGENGNWDVYPIWQLELEIEDRN